MSEKYYYLKKIDDYKTLKGVQSLKELNMPQEELCKDIRDKMPGNIAPFDLPDFAKAIAKEMQGKRTDIVSESDTKLNGVAPEIQSKLQGKTETQ